MGQRMTITQGATSNLITIPAADALARAWLVRVMATGYLSGVILPMLRAASLTAPDARLPDFGGTWSIWNDGTTISLRIPLVADDAAVIPTAAAFMDWCQTRGLIAEADAFVAIAHRSTNPLNPAVKPTPKPYRDEAKHA